MDIRKNAIGIVALVRNSTKSPQLTLRIQKSDFLNNSLANFNGFGLRLDIFWQVVMIPEDEPHKGVQEVISSLGNLDSVL